MLANVNFACNREKHLSTNILIKVYGHIWPTSSDLLNALMPLVPNWEHSEQVFEIDGDLLRISYEGMYFPLDDVVPVLQSFLKKDSQGKLDYIDLEAWTITRHAITGQNIIISHRSLNDVMDYSGH